MSSGSRSLRRSSKAPTIVAWLAILFTGLGIYLVLRRTDDFQALSGMMIFGISIAVLTLGVPALSRASPVRKVPLDIVFLNPSSWDNHLHVSWPKDQPRLQFRFGEWTSRETKDQLVELIVDRAPPRHRTYFMVLEEISGKYEPHHELKKVLRNSGESFYEKQSPGPSSLLFGSSSASDVIRFILDHYEFEYTSIGGTYFFVAVHEPANWRDKLEGLPRVTEDLIEKSYVVVTPVWEHGFEIASNKISEKELITQSAEIAKLHATELKVSWFIN